MQDERKMDMPQEKKLTFMPGVEGVQQISLSDLLSMSDAGILTAEDVNKIRKINKAHVNVLANSDENEWPPIEQGFSQIPKRTHLDCKNPL
jgi:hypothetical protein